MRLHVATSGWERTAAARIAPPPARAGVTLLEVMISIFVMLIGVLGVAALIPAGRYSATEALKADRSAAIARVALRDAKVQEVLNPQMWLKYDQTRAVTLSATTNNGAYSVIIDPLLMARPRVYGAPPSGINLDQFPYRNPASIALPPRVMLAPAMFPWYWTSNLWRNYVNDGLKASYAVAVRRFTSTDDLVFDVSTDADQRTRGLFLRDDGRTYNYLVASKRISSADITTLATGGVSMPANSGAYSWLICMTPALEEFEAPLHSSQLYTVSAVVFYRRDMSLNATADALGERPAAISTYSGFGWGGGTLTLSANSTYGASSDQYLEMNAGDWLAVIGVLTWPNSSSGTSSIPIVRWYKVTSPGTTAASGGTYQRIVTVAGPDWQDFGSANYSARAAVVVPNVAAVFSTTIRLERQVLWQRDG